MLQAATSVSEEGRRGEAKKQFPKSGRYNAGLSHPLREKLENKEERLKSQTPYLTIMRQNMNTKGRIWFHCMHPNNSYRNPKCGEEEEAPMF